jgi:membrane-associated phospholipid phosphatase
MQRAVLMAIGFSSLLLAQDDFGRPVSWKELAPNIANDQKRIWTYPARAFKRQNILPTVAFLATTAALLTADPTEGKYFHNTSNFHGFNQTFSSTNTSLLILAAPVSIYAAGLIKHDSKLQKTALLAGEAVADSEILATVLKAVDRRARPASFANQGNYWDSWTDGSSTNGSFPSGHTIAAFSVATVISRQYGRSHRWLPYVAYGTATLIGFSRLSLGAHFTTDVFAGAALGYAISRFAVLQN